MTRHFDTSRQFVLVLRSFTILFMKLDDIWVDPYNPVILKHWRANMDIQLVGNDDSCAFYVCKYVCKAEPEELCDTLSALFSNPNFNSLGLRKRLIMIGTCVLKT